eukprot:Tbor_TRINITY_DN5998_c2_g1::TRINITY_DN5998_c2_g1_i4::g.18172::m.18172
MASRCMTSLPSNGGGEEYYMDGWSVQIGEPERGIKELFNKTPKPQFREQRREGAHRGPGGNDKARVYGAGPIRNDLVRHESQLNNIQLDQVLHKVLDVAGIEWMSAFHNKEN